jgi:hypothetical protein
MFCQDIHIAMVPIRFIDTAGRPTADYVQGWPVVEVDIHLGFDMASYQPKEPIRPKFQRLLAIIDTGANHTTVDPSLTQGLVPRREIEAVNVGVRRRATAIGALIAIIGMPKPWALEIGASSLEGAPSRMLLGRDIISNYRLVYDTPRGQFYLE